MKNLYLLPLLILGSIMGQAQTIIEPTLNETMRLNGTDEPIEVVVLMKAQYDRQQLCRQAAFFPTKATRRDYVVSELKSFADASQQDLKSTLIKMEEQGLVTRTHSLWSANALYFTATKQAILDLSERTDIERISLNTQHQWIPEEEMPSPSSNMRETTPNIIQVKADQVWTQGNTGQGVVIAVIDSGVNYEHLDLADHLWNGGEAFPHHGYDVVNDDDDPMDDKGHGTHCAGTVCGDGTAGTLTGIAPDATLMCVKSVRDDGFGGAVNIAGGMEWAVEHGCDAISMSLGMVNVETADKEILRRTCEAILDAGVISLVCAGNEGHLQFVSPIPNNVRVPASCPPPYLDPDQMANPGGLSCVMAIGAVDYNDVAANFTSQGPVTWQDTEFGDYAHEPDIGLIRPDLCAPGVNIKSLDYNNIHGYSELSGTSQATPCVAGVVALMLSKNPELTPAQICQILEETALKLTPAKSNITGIGRVDALAAVNAVPTWNGVDESITNDPEMSHEAFLQVIDMTGRIVLSRRNSESRDGVHTVSIEDGLRPGIYILRLITRNQVKTQKILVR